MKAKLLCYSLGECSRSARANFHNEMYGYKDHSNRGKYVYERKGLMERTRSKKIVDSVILTTQSDAPKIVKLLKKYGAKIYMFSVLTRKKL